MLRSPIVGLRDARLNKLELLRQKGINPYPSKSNRTRYARVVHEDYEQLQGQTVTVAGRLMSLRSHGALSFGTLQDQTGRLQVFLRKPVLLPTDPGSGSIGYSDLNLLDVGDIIEASGTVTRTERGEISVLAKSLRLLVKSLRPLPDKWSGLKDRESVLRRRYLDTTVTPEHKDTFDAISRMLFAIRLFMNERGFIEVLTPVLQPQYGGGTAKPFITHLNALDQDLYLAISHELYLKRMIAAGFDKVYTIGKYFRNEGIDRSHHPEFSMLETMAAYENYEHSMDLIEDLFRYIAVSAFGRTRFVVRGHEIDFGEPWRRISMADAVEAAAGVDFMKCSSVEEANEILRSLNIKESQPTIGLALAEAFELVASPQLITPTLVFGHPVEISPLAKASEADPRFAERFEIFIAGMECGDNWSEQNDPIELLNRWKSLIESRGVIDEETHPLDYDFIEVLEHGMPPTTGIGPGIERMAMIFTGAENIDDVIFFPLMKPVLSAANAAIYGTELTSTSLADSETITIKPDETKGLIITFDEFYALIADGILCPESRSIIIQPFLRIWPYGDSSRRWRASGFIKLAGYLNNQTVQVVGYISETEHEPDADDESRRFVDLIDLSILPAITRYCGAHQVQIADVVLVDGRTVMNQE